MVHFLYYNSLVINEIAVLKISIKLQLLTENAYDNLFDDDLNELLWRRELAGFKRRERLDVKKPGPPFSTNNYAFKIPSTSGKYSRIDLASLICK